VRYGPIERVKNHGTETVAFYPWVTRKNGSITIKSTIPHYKQITSYINKQLDSVPKTFQQPKDRDLILLYAIYWTIYIAFAISSHNLVTLVTSLLPDAEKDEIKNKLYCLRLAGWIDSEAYSGKEYFFTSWDRDPYAYSFAAGTADRDSVRRKAIVTSALAKFENAPPHIRKVAAFRRQENE